MAVYAVVLRTDPVAVQTATLDAEILCGCLVFMPWSSVRTLSWCRPPPRTLRSFVAVYAVVFCTDPVVVLCTDPVIVQIATEDAEILCCSLCRGPLQTTWWCRSPPWTLRSSVAVYVVVLCTDPVVVQTAAVDAEILCGCLCRGPLYRPCGGADRRRGR